MRSYPAESAPVLYVGRWAGTGGARVSRADFARALIRFRGGELRLDADGDFTASLDGGAPKKAASFRTSGGVHTVFVTAMRGAALRGFAADELLDTDEFFRGEMLAEYEEIRRGRAVTDPAVWRPVPYAAPLLTRNVALNGLFAEIFDRHVDQIKRCFAAPHFVEDDNSDWYNWLPAANDGRMLGGAAGALRWREDPELRRIVDEIVDRAERRARADGWYNYYPEDAAFLPQTNGYSERKNYDRTNWTRGMLYAHRAGNPKAASLLRRMYDWLEASPYGPEMLDGGNATNSFLGSLLVADSGFGKPEDLLFNRRYLDQKYWEDALIRRDPAAFSNYPGHGPHCYDLLELLALAYEYRLTGETRCLDALRGGWDLYRDHYKHVGGATAICEDGGPYPPGSYYLDYGHNGETCGSVFWIWVNEELQQLFPGDVRYAEEIEEALLNLVPSFFLFRGNGFTRYHNRLEGLKEPGEGVGSCCEVMSSFLLSDLPGYVCAEDGEGVWIHQYLPSSVRVGNGLAFSLEADLWNDPAVRITVDGAPERETAVRLRIPSWAASVRLSVNGAAVPAGPGTYAAVSRVWVPGDRVVLELVPALRAVRYTGAEQAADNAPRRALVYGPWLTALTGYEEDGIPRLAAGIPPDRLRRVDGAFCLPGGGPVRFVPYWTVADGRRFCCFPVWPD